MSKRLVVVLLGLGLVLSGCSSQLDSEATRECAFDLIWQATYGDPEKANAEAWEVAHAMCRGEGPLD